MSSSSEAAEKIARAVLYEGHILYPYRRSALKNRQPWSFGTLAPEIWSKANADAFRFHAECLAIATADALLTVRLRFLHLGELPSPIGSETAYGESIERVITAAALRLSELLTSSERVSFSLPPSGESDGQRWRPVAGELEISAEQLSKDAIKIGVTVSNTTVITPNSTRDEALLSALVAAHAAIQLSGGQFVSLLDPPAELAAAASSCRNTGVYPVLVGQPGERDQMLASPIILYEYPQIAPESLGDFSDSTEIDEMLALRVLTLTEEEKREMRSSGEQARAVLERIESLPPEQLLRVHGALRGLRRIEEQD
jgi:hypothetical protein